MRINTLNYLTKIIALFFLIPGTGLSQTTSPTSPLAVQNQPYDFCIPCLGSKWINTGDLGLTDNQYCSVLLQPDLTCYLDQCYWSRYLDCHGFGFSIPTNAVIKGIELDITGFCDMDDAVVDAEISLQKHNMPCGSNLASTDYWPTGNGTRSYGGCNELWGSTWTALEIDSAQFGVFIKVKNDTPFIPSVYFDEISIIVSYELATGIFQQSSSLNPLHVLNDNSAGNFVISFEMQKENKIAELNLYDTGGKKCFSSILSGKLGSISQQEISTSNLRSGIYFVNVNQDGKIYNAKIDLIK